MTVGEKIRVLRLREKWSQKRLGVELGVSETTIRNYESGRISVGGKHMQKLAQIFDVDVSVLRENSAEKYNDIMQLLFMLADEHGLATCDVEHVLPSDCVLVFNNRALQSYTNAWHKKRSQIEENNLSKDEMQAWELRFPASYAEDCEKAIRQARDRQKKED